jgi:DNA-directed RNA polymerase subunit K/omega
MPKRNDNKISTLYSNNKNVNISSVINTNNITGGSKKKNKTNEHNISDDDIDNIEEDEDIDEDEDDNLDENITETEEDIDENDENDENDETDNLDENEDDNKSIKSDNSIDETKNDASKTCYSKYALPDTDDVDFDELFIDDEFKINKILKLSKPILFKYEKVRLLSNRAKQLSQGAKPMIKNIEGLSSKEIALLELKNKLIPLIIERPVPNSGVERWKLSELEIIED